MSDRLVRGALGCALLMPAASAMAHSGAGLGAATVVLHATGAGLGRALAERLTLARALGSAVAAIGLVLLGAAA